MIDIRIQKIVERIDPWKLPMVDLENSGSLPSCPGIYCVLEESSVHRERRILYIGESIKVVQRMLSHGRKDQFRRAGDTIKIALYTGGSNEVAQQICKDKKLRRQLEAALNTLHKPEFYKPRTRYEQPKKRRSVTVTEQGWEGIRSQAAERGLSVSEFIEQIGRKGLQTKPVKQQVKPFCKRKRSTNRSSNHFSEGLSQSRQVQKPILKPLSKKR